MLQRRMIMKTKFNYEEHRAQVFLEAKQIRMVCKIKRVFRSMIKRRGDQERIYHGYIRNCLTILDQAKKDNAYRHSQNFMYLFLKDTGMVYDSINTFSRFF